MKTLMLITTLVLGMAVLHAEDDPALAQSRKKFEDADALLTTTLKETCAELDKVKAAALQKKEAVWVDFREERSAAAAQMNAGGKKVAAKLSAAYWEAMAVYTQERIAFLKTYSGKNASPGITGEFKDAYGGDLEMEETKDGINFTFSVVRGNEAHTGQISGTAERKSDTKAVFKQKLEPGQKGPACEIVFTFAEGHIVRVEEESPDKEAEPGVHYDGDYYKTSDPVIP